MFDKLKKGTIHIFGGTGLLGTSLKEVCIALNINFLTYSRSKSANIQLDISNPSDFSRIPRPLSDDYVVNLAAIAQPSLVFKNPDKAYLINVIGNNNILNWSGGYPRNYFFMSSVEVFDGSEDSYNESSIVSPLNIYGKQKVEAEKFTEKISLDKYIIGRTSWNISNNSIGRCLIDVMLDSLKKPNAIMAVDNIFTIASAYETACNILRALNADFSGTVHIASPTPISRYEIAELIVGTLSDCNLACEPCSFEDLKFEEPRSKRNILDTSLSLKSFEAQYSDPKAIIIKKLLTLNRT